MEWHRHLVKAHEIVSRFVEKYGKSKRNSEARHVSVSSHLCVARKVFQFKMYHITSWILESWLLTETPCQLSSNEDIICCVVPMLFACMNPEKSASLQLERVWGVRLVSMPCLYRWRNVCTHAYILYMHIYRWKTAEKNQISFYWVKQVLVWGFFTVLIYSDQYFFSVVVKMKFFGSMT